MSAPERLQALLAEYEVLRDGGSPQTPEELCRDCPDLLEEFRKQLRVLASADAFLGASDGGEAKPDLPGEEGIEGPLPAATRFRVLRPHARGGLGEVLVAQDEQLRRPVALKRLHRWHMRDPHRRQRFLREAELTCRLEHPSIVPVHAIGQDADGRPFYAMRLVEGETLDEAIRRYHAEAASRLDLSARHLAFRQLLQRFVAVCHTIAFAHSRGVIHRDIKPGNIVLGPFGDTMVVDWGLAKDVKDPETAMPDADRTGASATPPSPDAGLPAAPAATRPGAILGTPAYMSPEQAQGRTEDVGPATDIYSLGATLYCLLNGRPPAPPAGTGAGRDRPGDGQPTEVLRAPRPLAAVCRKAMMPRPADRYASAAVLADDLERWLADEPLAAYREGWAARLGRWGRRHRTLVRGLAAALLVGLAALAVGLVIVTGLNRRLDRANEELIATEAAERRARTRAEKLLASFNSMVGAFRTINPADVKNVTVAEVLRGMAQHFSRDETLDAATRGGLLDGIAQTYLRLGLPREAVEAAERAVALHQADSGSGQPDTLLSMNNLGAAYRAAGRRADAISLLEKVVDASKGTLGLDHADTAAAMANLAGAYHDERRLSDAETLFEQALAVLRAQLPPRHPRTLIALGELAAAYQRDGRIDEALPIFEEVLEASRLGLGPDHPDTLAEMNNVAFAYQAAGRLADAVGMFEEVLTRCRDTLGPDHPNAVGALNNLARAYKDAGRLSEALPRLEEVAERCKRVFGPEHAKTISSIDGLAIAYLAADQPDKGLPLLRDALAAYRQQFPPRSSALLSALFGRGSDLVDYGYFTDAEPLLRECLAVGETSHPDHWTTFSTQSVLGASLAGQRKYAEAEPLLVSGFEGMKAREAKIPSGHKHRLAKALDRLVNLYDAWEKPDEAAKWRARRDPERALPPAGK
jgi:tetratricopeptide (TPR) repeat protein/tRNA A-37 threonylcarbamoyl transferase component Bud32